MVSSVGSLPLLVLFRYLFQRGNDECLLGKRNFGDYYRCMIVSSPKSTLTRIDRYWNPSSSETRYSKRSCYRQQQYMRFRYRPGDLKLHMSYHLASEGSETRILVDTGSGSRGYSHQHGTSNETCPQVVCTYHAVCRTGGSHASMGGYALEQG